jgi:hypothetical protein
MNMQTTTGSVAGNRRRNEDALARFVGVVAEIQAALTGIREAADDHFGVRPEEVHWAHVGDAARIRDGLNEILAIIRNEVQ